jgi:MFS family permease
MDTSIFSHINWLAVLVAAVAYFMIGGLWYSKVLFGPKWASLVGLNMNDPEKNKGVVKLMIGSFIFMLITCIGLALLVVRMDLFILSSGIKLGLITGICFAVTAVAITYIYESKPTALYAITCGYHLIGNIAAAVILVLWR